MNQEQKNKAEKLFGEYQNRRISSGDLDKADKKASNLGSRIADFKLLLRLMKDVLGGRYKISAKEIAILGGAIAYVISPIDAIPDVIPVIGWVDDISVVGLAMTSLAGVLSAYKFKNGIK
ncbi:MULTISPECIES: YkvA family protein [Myroides]|uniref:Uncharacterized membrane protein YkvA, DUF1232 family n=1 Tax=Myroides profundi TaxID=480520 RepID=A0AAJ5BEC7_MYRPR|nr:MULTISPECIES: YkvA family protein [Myroides]AJH15535.1 hypothetical protein MPR_2364 [Myroides profundi]EPH13701.1 hypothetical protein HMPREF9713_00484 [Myroides odoratimimus CCUG 12700]MCO7724112.1 YkvA family protein [Myroides odoratimimus]MDM1450665.1 DUF1232 domain-containing protein [Myroides odoratimimus]MEC4042076.1 YkvA family protein [Myroides odoratimimus]